MIPVLVALGVFDGAGAVLPTPADRVIRLSRANGFVTAGQTIDPSDELNFLIDLSPLLETGEAFTSVTLTVLPSSAALGFSISATGPRAAQQVDESHVAIWPLIDAAFRSAFPKAPGIVCSFEVKAVSDSDPTRTWQSTVNIKVGQK